MSLQLETLREFLCGGRRERKEERNMAKEKRRETVMDKQGKSTLEGVRE